MQYQERLKPILEAMSNLETVPVTVSLQFLELLGDRDSNPDRQIQKLDISIVCKR